MTAIEHPVTGRRPHPVAAPPPEDVLERADELALLDDLLASVTGTGRGRVVLVAGEAGIGKTALLQAFARRVRGVRVLAGAAEPLQTPRPLGPLLDVAAETGGELAARVESGAGPSDVLRALLDELRRRPTLVVLEDLHWADEATLDLLRLLARRVTGVPALVAVTYRDELDRHHPLRVTLGELPPAAVTRTTLAPLSPAAVATLAAPYHMDADELHRRTGGNPFYVTEALAAGGATVPAGVRDAVLARAARLSPGARALLDAVAVAPPRAELWLLEALAGGDVAHLEECLTAGMLRSRGDAVAFRHEIARVAVEAALPPDRALALHRAAVAALAGRPVDPARVAHHAEAAGDGKAVLRYASAAGERASRLGAHREAAAQLARALRFAGGLPGRERAALLERHSYESYLTASICDAIDSRRRALAEYAARGDKLREGDARRWLSRLLWYAGDGPTAEIEGCLAVDILEELPPGPELAMAYSNVAQLRMLASDWEAARRWGERAIALAERLGETQILVHALNNVGAADLKRGVREGAHEVLRSLELALAAGLEDDVGRAHTNLVAGGVHIRDYALADRHLEEGLAYSIERDLDHCRTYMTGWQARSQLDRGRWNDAAATAAHVLDGPEVPVPTRITPLVVVGLLRARGGADPWEALDEALALAQETRELQRLAPVAAARAEARWLAGEAELVAAETDAVLPLALRSDDPWAAGELAAWRRRAGLRDVLPPARIATPFRLELEGDAEAAAAAWRALGCPYDAALALVGSRDEAALRTSLAELQRLGARPAAARVARILRERGVRDLTRGPRASTRANPGGLTARELDVLALLVDGLRNAEIAERLVVSAKTVDHHVSAILRKLRAATRTEAAAEARRLGLLEHR